MESPEFALSRDEARWVAVTAAGLARRPFRRRPTHEDILAAVRHLGMVQLDTISVISRSHETVLWSRLGPYDTAVWPELYDPGMALTEYMAHAAAIIPIETLPLFRSAMERFRARDAWSPEPANRAVMDGVLSRLRSEGPLASRDFERPGDGRKAEAWEWHGLKPERRALNALWLRGETVLRKREASFSRVFDVTEHVVPGFWEAEQMPEDVRFRTFLRRAMRVLGIGAARWAADYFRSGGLDHVSLASARRGLAELEAAGEVIRVSVKGFGEPVWLDSHYIELVERLRLGRERPSLTTFLSPFDNLIWNRDRCEVLFDFHYRLECYTPAAKRVYGYYSLPILYRGKVIGRLDPSFDRKRRFLSIRSLHIEPWVRPSEAMLSAVRGAIEDLVRFLGGEAGDWTLLACNRKEILPRMTSDRAPGPVDER